MKTQSNCLAKKILTSSLIIAAFIIGSFAQKSNSLIYIDSNQISINAIVAEINHAENKIPGLIIRPAISSKIFNIIEINKSELLIEEDEELKIESWMLDESHFINDKAIPLNPEVEDDEPLPVEDWMMDESHFSSNKNTEYSFNEEQEEKMQVEAWMMDEAHFFTKNTSSGLSLQLKPLK